MAVGRLKPYGAMHKGLEVGKLVEVLESWLYLVESTGCKENPFHAKLSPHLRLKDA